MLTEEAMNSREWVGLVTLRQMLGDKRLQEFENSHYVTSVSNIELDHYRRVAAIAGLVLHERKMLVEGLGLQASQPEARLNRDAILMDLQLLADSLRSLSDRLATLAEEVRSVQGQVYRGV